jgi:ATP-dependent Zn protease
MRTAKQIRTETAYHEAGHVVAAYLVGLGITNVFILSETEVEASSAARPRARASSRTSSDRSCS